MQHLLSLTGFRRALGTVAAIAAVLAILTLSGCDLPRNSGGGSSGGGHSGHSH